MCLYMYGVENKITMGTFRRIINQKNIGYPKTFDNGAFISKVQPEVTMLFILSWHRLSIKALLFSGSVSSERSSSSAPCFYAPKVRTDLHSDSTAATLPPKEISVLFVWISNISAESALLFGSVKGESDFTHFKLAPRLRFLLICRTPECVCGEQGVDKRLLNGGGKCSRGVQTPRSGWEWGVFVAELWRWSCVTNSAMRKTYFKTRNSTSSTEVGAMASLRRSL